MQLIDLTKKGEAYVAAHSPVSTRADLEAKIEALIAQLDALDGDPDLEPSVSAIGYNVTDDREGCDVLDEGEQSLGWTLAMKQDGRRWFAHDWSGLDCEAEHDGREPDDDDEDSDPDHGIEDVAHDEDMFL